jgi:hypothetical protein
MLMAAPMLLGRSKGSDAESLAPYMPTIRLSESPKTIEARVQLEPTLSRIPPFDLESKRGDMEVTTSGLMDGELTDLIRQALLSEFRTNLLFSSVRLHDEHPDLLVQCVIYQFAEYRSRPWYAKLPMVGSLLNPNEQIEGGVNIELIVSAPTGYYVGAYEGRSLFPDLKWPTSEKDKIQRAPGYQLNRAFTEAMRQIRDRMLADPELITGKWRMG